MFDRKNSETLSVYSTYRRVCIRVGTSRNLCVQFRRVVSSAIVNYEKQMLVDDDLRDIQEIDN